MSMMKLSDPSYRLKLIEYLPVVLLIGIAICGLLIGSTAIKILHSYDDNPIFQADLVFKIRNPSSEEDGMPLFSPIQKSISVKVLNNTRDIKPPEVKANQTEEQDARQKRYAFVLPKGRVVKGTGLRSSSDTNDTSFNEQDHIFLTTMTVDTTYSKWGPVSLQNYIIFFPFVLQIAAIIWATILVIYRTDTVRQRTGLMKPWMIVVPSIIFFTIMSLLSIIYLSIIHWVWRDFCNEIHSQLVDKTIECMVAAQALQPHRHNFFLDLSVHISIFRYCSDIIAVLSILGLIIMLLRCIFAVDFQVIKVTVSYISPEDAQKNKELDEDLLTPVAVREENDDESRVVNIRFANDPNAKVKLLSQERGSEDDFHSAHSILTVFSTNEDEHPSLEPLIKNKSIEKQSEV